MRNPQEKALPTQTNQSSDKLLRILELLAEQPEPLRLQDIAQLCSMNSSTVLRFITALQRRNYVAQEIDTGKYYLTFKLCALAERISANKTVRNVALPYLRKIAQECLESCNLAIEDDGTVVYIEIINAPGQTLLSTQRIGNVAPMYCTGVGKLFLTDYTDEALGQLLEKSPPVRYTDRTLTSKAALAQELERVRAAGYAYDNEECEDGVRCIAVPVRDYTGRVIAGISVSGPVMRMTDSFIQDHLPLIVDSARQVSVLMGWPAE